MPARFELGRLAKSRVSGVARSEPRFSQWRGRWGAEPHSRRPRSAAGSERRPRRSLRAGTGATRPGAGVMTDASGHAAVSLRQVDKYYGAYHALRSIDLEIAPRERIDRKSVV